MKRKIFIGVAWPYVNGNLHVGHYAGYLLPADICARYHRLSGNDVLMVSGSDCHGTPITVESDKRGRSPQEIVEEYHAKDINLFLNVLGLSYDLYTRTDTPHHHRIVQNFFIKLLEAGYIFIDTTQQYYSEKEKKFLPDRYIVGTCPHCGFKDARSDYCEGCNKILEQGEVINPLSKLSDSKVELRDTQHYFLDWSRMQPKLENYVTEYGRNWRDWIYQETRGWLKERLKPRAITRDLDWGVPLPVNRIPKDKLIKDIENKRIYVWFDAVIGYYSASLLWARMQEYGLDQKKAELQVPSQEEETDLLNGQLADWWQPSPHEVPGTVSKHYYFMGQDNLVFHTLFWPGQLMIYNSNLHLPDVICINKFLNLAGQKFSKSRGISIDIKEFVEKYGNDIVRFYLTYIMPENKQASFYWEDFKEKVNSILIGNIGNFVHRSLSIAKGADINLIKDQQIKKEIEEEINKAFQNSRNFLENCQFRNYLEVIINLSAFGNKFFDTTKVWEIKKSDSENYFWALKQLYLLIISIAYLLMPLMPKTSEEIFKMLGLRSPQLWPSLQNEVNYLNELVSQINTDTRSHPLFTKIETANLP